MSSPVTRKGDRQRASTASVAAGSAGRLLAVIRAATAVAIVATSPVMAQQEGEPVLTEVWEPEPRLVGPGKRGAPPSDAVVLFDGTTLDAWRGVDGDAAWAIEDGVLTVVPGAGDIISRQAFGDVQLHIEWRTPAVVVGEGQEPGNSGVFLMQRYEVQVLNSWNNRTYSNGQAASIYKQYIPQVNASRPPGQWQTYDILFQAPWFGEGGGIERPATMTVLHNGVLVQHHVRLHGSTAFIGGAAYETHGSKEPLQLQDHLEPVSFRNIWIRELPPPLGGE
jgi:hypothetical protein